MTPMYSDDAVPYPSTPAGVPVVDCATCGRRHPATREHCPTCGAPSLFPHPHTTEEQP